MKGLQILLCGILFVSATGSLAETPPKWIAFDRLCGSLEFFTPVPGGGKDSKPLKNVRLELYPWEERIACCSKSHPFFKTVTGKDGRYEFKNVDAGHYWLVAHWGAKHFQIPIVFTANDSPPEDCELQGLDIDSSGNFGSWIRSTM